MYQLLASNDDFVVVAKWPGVNVHADDHAEGLTRQLASDLGFPVYLVHRLDKATSGVMVFARTAQVAATLGEAFAKHQVQKYYWALSEHKPNKKQGLIRGDMEKSRRGSFRLSKSLTNPAVTQFQSYSLKPGLRLFVLKPLTGKTHQLRVALKSISAPITGDERYGAVEQAVAHVRCYLHAYALSFEWKGETKTFVNLPSASLMGESNPNDLFVVLKAYLEGAEQADMAYSLDSTQTKEITEPWQINWPKPPKLPRSAD
ncbi:MAG: TIGR01621 family pseudouridine synthase [Pontibacterium sp.]